MNSMIVSGCSCRPVALNFQRSSARPVTRPQHSRHHIRVQASGPGSTKPGQGLSEGNSSSSQSWVQDSDLAFVGKLVALSFAGALVVKYGSLLISLPFEPSPAVATAVVLGTPALYSLYLLTLSGKQQ